MIVMVDVSGMKAGFKLFLKTQVRLFFILVAVCKFYTTGTHYSGIYK